MIEIFGQAGARKVYAVEASVMAEYAKKLVKENPGRWQALRITSQVDSMRIADVLLSLYLSCLVVVGINLHFKLCRICSVN